MFNVEKIADNIIIIKHKKSHKKWKKKLLQEGGRKCEVVTVQREKYDFFTSRSAIKNEE